MALKQENRWAARPHAALALRTTVYVLPLVGSAAIAYLSRTWFDATFPAAPTVVAIVFSVALASATLVVGERLLRRLLPLVLLLRLSLLFPDQVPSRLGIALKAASPKRLARIAESPDHTDAPWAERVLALAATLNAHDRRTRGHSERVRALTMLVGDDLGIVGEDRDKLEWAALLHDIGKLTVPVEILNKKGRPDDAEWATLQGHPAAGAVLASDLREWLGPWLHAIDQHHERFDGSGYPHQIARDDIAMSGRIVALTDAFETMTATRSYKKPMSVEGARKELVKCSGSHFDPAVVRAFMNISLGQLHRALGPLSWLTSLPFAAGVSQGVRLGGTIVGGAPAPVLAAAAVVMLASPAAGLISSAAGPATLDRPDAAAAAPETDTEDLPGAGDLIVAAGAVEGDRTVTSSDGSRVRPDAAGQEDEPHADESHPDDDRPEAEAPGAPAPDTAGLGPDRSDTSDTDPVEDEADPTEQPGADPAATAPDPDPIGGVVGTVTDTVGSTVGALEPTLEQVDETVEGLTGNVEQIVSTVVEDPLSVGGTVEAVVDTTEDLVSDVEDLTGTVGGLLEGGSSGSTPGSSGSSGSTQSQETQPSGSGLGQLTGGLLGLG